MRHDSGEKGWGVDKVEEIQAKARPPRGRFSGSQETLLEL